MMHLDNYYTIRDIIKEHNVPNSTVNSWINRGELPAVKVHGIWLIEKKDWESFVANIEPFKRSKKSNPDDYNHIREREPESLYTSSTTILVDRRLVKMSVVEENRKILQEKIKQWQQERLV